MSTNIKIKNTSERFSKKEKKKKIQVKAPTQYQFARSYRMGYTFSTYC